MSIFDCGTKHSARIVPLLALFLICPALVVAQGEIKIDATGEVRVPADRIEFRVQITATAQTPADAFEDHKNQEQKLVEYIRKAGLEDRIRSFEPTSISSRQTRDSRQFVTSQTVILDLDDFEGFEELQLLLINAGFEQFTARFRSTKLDSARDQALEQAIRNAESKANLMARAVGKKVGDVIRMEHSSYQVDMPGEFRLQEMRSDMGSMLDFETTIPVSSSITLVYSLEEAPE